MARDFPRRLLYIALTSLPQRADPSCGRMVGQSIQPSNGILAGCFLGDRFARVIFLQDLGQREPAPVETRQFVDDLATMSAANNEDDVTRSLSFVTSWRHPSSTLNKNKSMTVSNRKSLAKRVQRILRVSDLHILVADATRDLGIHAVGGARRRRSTRNLKPRAARRPGSRVKVLARKNRKAVKLYTTGIWPSIACGVEQHGLSPTDLKQVRAAPAACSEVGGYQNCPVTAIEVGIFQHQNPVVQASLCIFSWWLLF